MTVTVDKIFLLQHILLYMFWKQEVSFFKASRTVDIYTGIRMEYIALSCLSTWTSN